MTDAASAAVTSWLGVPGVDLFTVERMISQHHDCSRRPEKHTISPCQQSLRPDLRYAFMLHSESAMRNHDSETEYR